MTAALDVLSGLLLEDGRTWGDVALDWQWADAEAILDLDSSTSMHFLTRARGGSKDTDTAAIGIAALLEQLPAASRSYVFAVDRDQAALLVDSLAGLVQRSGLTGVLTVDNFKCTAVQTGATLEVMASDGASAYGLRPHLVIANEVAQWPKANRKVWDAMISAVPKVSRCRLVVLTSAGDPGHWSYKVREQALTSPRWRLHEVPGPVPWIAEDALKEQRSLLTESQYARLHLNVWTAAEDRLTTPEQVRACVGHDGLLEPVLGRRYVCGLDVGLTNDRTVFTVAHAEQREGKTIVVVDRQTVWQGTKARPVRLSDVETVIHETIRRYRGAKLVADPYQAVHICQRLRGRGIRVNEFTFSSSSVGRLALALYRLLRDAALDLPGDDQELLNELANVRLVENAPGSYRIDHDSGSHDDRVISLALAAHALVEHSTPRYATTSSPARSPIQTGSTVTPGAVSRRVGKFVIPASLSGSYANPEESG